MGQLAARHTAKARGEAGVIKQPSARCRYLVRFGSKADMCGAQADVRFVPIAGIDAVGHLSPIVTYRSPFLAILCPVTG